MGKFGREPKNPIKTCALFSCKIWLASVGEKMRHHFKEESVESSSEL